MTNHVVMFSGGVDSWATAKLVAQQYGTDSLYLVFADTKIEDEDLYRFLDESAKNIGGKLIKLEDGRDPWQVFWDRKFLGNTRKDPCSYFLKRKLINDWMEKNFNYQDTVIYIGIRYSEKKRFERSQKYWHPWTVKSPLLDKPALEKNDILEWIEDEGIDIPRLYHMNLPTANCGGRCIKMGQAAWKQLLQNWPDRYYEWERLEEQFRQDFNKDVAILRDRRGGTTKPLTLKQLRERIETEQAPVNENDIGSCSCFSPMSYDENAEES